MDQKNRTTLIASLAFVDAVILFNEQTPKKLIKQIIPDITSTKGGDYKKEKSCRI